MPDALEAKLASLQVRGLTATKVRGVGDYTDLLARDRLTDGVKIEIFVDASRVEMAPEAVMDVAHSDLPGAGIVGGHASGKIFPRSYPVRNFSRWGLRFDIEECLLKTAIGIFAVTLLFGSVALTAHATNTSGAEAAARTARSPAVTDAWARATVPGQPVGAAYMKISSPFHVTLIGVETDVAKQVQVHDMQMNDGVMQMRRHDQLDIPKGKTVELVPGGMHLMLLGLKKPLKAGDAITVTMTFVDAEKAKITSVVTVSVRPIGQ